MAATSFKSLISMTLLAASIGLAAPVFAADNDASMHQVYLAAEAGKFTEAQAMMDKVLRDHPNSGKAHFVEAELMAKQGNYSGARGELAAAERLAPGLPFARPAAVQHLKTLLSGQQTGTTNRAVSDARQAAPPVQQEHRGMPWGLLLLGVLLIGFIVMAVRFMARRAAAPSPSPSYTLNGGGPANYGNPQPAPYSGGPAGGTMGPTGGGVGGGMAGMGSGIVGGLATGAAVGAGLVAGEALMHHFTDGDRSAAAGQVPAYQPVAAPQNDDMGGTDFGVADNGSWDDSSSTDDWS
jgi:hypothetical protein